MNDVTANVEILAPAGGRESLEAAVRCGAHAVYLGGKSMSARAGADNFDETQLREAVSYCHVRGVKVYQAMNTLVFDDELAEAARMIETACEAGVDALITQDLGLAAVARRMAPDMALHASTQMGVHSLEGVRALEELGFARVVLARELSREEIGHIARHTSLELECFVHGALCMCVSGQCYLSAAIGGRSGNRGQCAQPCRLPFSLSENPHALSLKDLSLVDGVRDMAEIGVRSLKIEGRLKRPEYVAAAVTACRRALTGEQVDFDALQAVFSRGGFTKGYYTGERGAEMFGTRGRQDVQAASGVLKGLAEAYRKETALVPVRFALRLRAGEPAELVVRDSGERSFLARGETPQAARTAPTTPEKAEAALSKTGDTPYFVEHVQCEIGQGLMLPVSALNRLRRDALEGLSALREKREGGRCDCRQAPELLCIPPHRVSHGRTVRVRLHSAEQLSPGLAAAELVILPLAELLRIPAQVRESWSARLAAELPRVRFHPSGSLERDLARAMELGIRHAVAGDLGGLRAAVQTGMITHGDFGLNAANGLALREYARMGLRDCTLSIEADRTRINNLGGELPRGIVAYGHLPLMITRCFPGGFSPAPGGEWLRDRKDMRFWVCLEDGGGYAQMHNSVPLFLADRLDEWDKVEFLTLYCTRESPEECARVLEQYLGGAEAAGERTRGLYYRRVK